MSTPRTRSVACPSCKQVIEYSVNNPYRPFCSKRCKMIDLGLWASEQYAIPAEVISGDSGEEPPTQ